MLDDVPVWGDTNCSWFDPGWPFVGKLDRKWSDTSSMRDVKSVQLSLGDLVQVAMFAGAKDTFMPQELLCTAGSRWLVLRNRLVGRYSGWDTQTDYADASESFWFLGNGGDLSLRNASTWLADRGFVQSPMWPLILRRTPQLATVVPFLIECKYLLPDGSHPSHRIAAVETKTGILLGDLSEGLSDDGRTFTWGGREFPLTEKARDLITVLQNALAIGQRWNHDEYLKVEGNFKSDVRTLVRDQNLSAIVIRQPGKKAMWGLIDPKDLKKN